MSQLVLHALIWKDPVVRWRYLGPVREGRLLACVLNSAASDLTGLKLAMVAVMPRKSVHATPQGTAHPMRARVKHFLAYH